MSSIVGTEIVPVAELSRMPYVVGPLALMPNLILAGVHQPPSHVVGSANVSEIVHVLVGAANVDQVFPQRAHAGTVVAGVDQIRLVPWTRRFTVHHVIFPCVVISSSGG